MSGIKKEYVLIMAAAALWGCIGVFFRILTGAGLTPMQSVALRVILAAVIYTLYLLITDRQALKIRLKDIYYFIGTGIVSLVFFNWCYFSTIAASSMSVAAVLLYTAPIFVMMMSAVLFREKINGKKLLALFMTFSGCLLVTGLIAGGDERLSTAAIFTGLGSGIGYALYTIFGKYALRKYGAKTVTAYTFIVGAVGVAPISGIWKAGDVLLSRPVILGGIGISVVCCILPYILYTKGLERAEAGKAAIVATLEPVVAAILGISVFGDSVTAMKLAGMLLIVSAVIILNLGSLNRKKGEADKNG